MPDTDEQILLAKLAYVAYGETTGFRNFQGNPMPSWNNLGDTIQAAWIAAANAVQDHLSRSPATDR